MSATPGPWELRAVDDGHVIHMGTFLVRGGRKNPLHEINYSHGICFDDDYPQAQDEYAEAEANARLIALVPEFFEYVESSAQNGCATAQALVAKANGEQVHSDPLPKEVGR